MKKIVLSGLIIALGLLANAQSYRSYPLSTAPSNEKDVAIYYNLPQTELVFEVKVNKTTKNKGVFSQSAYLLGLKNVITSDETLYSIQDIKISSRLVCTAEQTYVMYIKPENVNVIKSENGVLAAIESKDPKSKQTLSLSLKEREKRDFLNKKPSEEKQRQELTLPTKPIYEQKLLRAGMLDKMPNIKAEDAVRKINELREKQIEILSGSLDGTYINTTVDFMYKQLDEIIDGYISLFTGLERVEEEVYYFSILPQKPIIPEEDLLLPIFRFSETEGISSVDIKNDVPMVMARLHTMNKTKQIARLEENNAKDEKLQAQIAKNGRGIYYIEPESVDVSVNYKKNTFSKTLNISQYGVLTSIDAINGTILFDTKTAGIKSILNK